MAASFNPDAGSFLQANSDDVAVFCFPEDEHTKELFDN
jgi:hypothetical protein